MSRNGRTPSSSLPSRPCATSCLLQSSHHHMPASFSIDVRQHVKIKKIPGGMPCDSEYVDGAVITTNVVHKQMVRTVSNPWVMLVTLPFEFHCIEGQYMHLDPLVNKEKHTLPISWDTLPHSAPMSSLLKSLSAVLRLRLWLNTILQLHAPLSCIITASILHFKEHTTYCLRLSTATGA